MNCRTLNNPYSGVRPAEIIALQFKGKNSQKPEEKKKGENKVNFRGDREKGSRKKFITISKPSEKEKGKN